MRAGRFRVQLYRWHAVAAQKRNSNALALLVDQSDSRAQLDFVARYRTLGRPFTYGEGADGGLPVIDRRVQSWARRSVGALVTAVLVVCALPSVASALSGAITGGTANSTWTQGHVDDLSVTMDGCTDPQTPCQWAGKAGVWPAADRKSTRLNSSHRC